jgi:germination protein M
MMPGKRLARTLMLLLVTILAGTGTAWADAADATPTAATPTAQPATVSVYFFRAARRGDKLGAAHRAVDAPTVAHAARAAMRELFQGPTKTERAAGLTSDLPKATHVLDLALDESAKLATVNLSAVFAPDDTNPVAAHQAQVVFTLTQFPNVERVAIEVEGKPIAMLDGDGKPLAGPAARADYERLTPLIFLESPAPGDTIASPVRLWGTANTFEATFIAEVHDAAGETLVHQIVIATSGNGFRGTFDVSLAFDPKQATAGEIDVYEISARDGSRDNEVVVPVTFAS